MVPRPRSEVPLKKAFDEARFGSRRTLNLRAQQPTTAEAVMRCDQWLRLQQVEGASEVLVITGRGLRSVGGFSPVREAIAALLPSLRRRNVIASFQEHNPGSFVVTLAPLKALFEAPRRRRERSSASSRRTIPQLAALEADTIALLSELASMQLDELGVRTPDAAMIEDQMLHVFSALSDAISSSAGKAGNTGGDVEARLQQALLRAIEAVDSK